MSAHCKAGNLDDLSIKILLVEDDDADARLVSLMLRDAPLEKYEIVRARNLGQALLLLHEHSIDAILLDLGLPDSRGVDTLLTVADAAESIAIIALTGLDDMETAAMAMSKGVQDYLIKGKVDADTLVRSLQYSLARKRCEMTVRHTGARYDFLFENHGEGVVALEGDGSIIHANPAAVALLGVELDELMGQYLGLPRSDGQPVALELGSDAESLRILEMRGMATDWGASKGYLVTLHDVSGARQGAGRIRLRQEQLQQSQRVDAISRLAGGLAHSFSNLLTAILGHAELMLKKMPLESPLRDEARAIFHAGRKGSDLTGQLLAFSRSQDFWPERLSLFETICGMEEKFRKIVGPDVEIQMDVPKDLSPVVGVKSQLEQVLLNLVHNARDAMPNGGMVRISAQDSASTEDDESAVEIAIQDTGVGMDAGTVSQAPQAFFSTKEKGVGLGLAVVQTIIAQHNGELVIGSEVGRGTTCRITLPAAREMVSAGGRQEVSALLTPEPGVPTQDCVLVLEDESALLSLAVTVLTDAGYDVLSASSIAQAVRLYSENKEKISLLFCDVVLPDGTGPEFAEHVRNQRPGTPVLLTSGHMDQSMGQSILDKHRYPFIGKPFAPADLVKYIGELLER